jgi:hypothetical protein
LPVFSQGKDFDESPTPMGGPGAAKSDFCDALGFLWLPASNTDREECILDNPPVRPGKLLAACDFTYKLERFVKHILGAGFDQERFYRLLA